jgi:formylglycine-generating enzyme required for sulfatase activity
MRWYPCLIGLCVLLGSLAIGNPVVAKTNNLGMKFVQLPGSEIWMSKYETRREEFAKFVADTGYDATQGMFSLRADAFDWAPNGDTWSSPGYAQTDDHPVVGVSLEDARAFCAWLNEREAEHLNGFVYRLPSDLEWSLAIGLEDAASDTPELRMKNGPGLYPWGDSWPPPKDFGNYAGTESAQDKPSWWGTIPGGYTDAFPRTAPVGTFPPNELGLYDLSGNVWEWVDSTFTADSVSYLARGGCWGSDRPAYLLTSRRNLAFSNSRNDETGFRVVLAPSD